MRTRWIVLFGLLLGLVTAAATTFYNRPYRGPAVPGTIGKCATDENNPYGICYELRPQGGFPLIHISDKRDGADPGVLSLRDDLYPISIAGNAAASIALWMAILLIVSMFMPRRRAEPPVEISPALAAAAAAALEASGQPAASPPAKADAPPPEQSPEAPKTETPKTEAPKTEAPKTEASPQPAPPPSPAP